MKRGRVSFNENGVVHEYDLVDPDALRIVTIVSTHQSKRVDVFSNPEAALNYIVRCVQEDGDLEGTCEWLRVNWKNRDELRASMMDWIESDQRTHEWGDYCEGNEFSLCGYHMYEKRVHV